MKIYYDIVRLDKASLILGTTDSFSLDRNAREMFREGSVVTIRTRSGSVADFPWSRVAEARRLERSTDQSDEAPVKRGRGRPPKTVSVDGGAD